MDVRKLVGCNVHRYRKAADLSQEEVAARMGVDRAHVGLIERGEQNATLLTIWSLCEALNVRPQALFDEDYYRAHCQ
ncbi:DNA-binding transcriptional regulator, XRE-family HTH domain [Sphingopyxis sp. YR583]|uniref:helix-turn-helix transcriptional regulator n=1 Tax=Sphingopyxis sp. YR583 TaxID=1881047 RepID=UPI0008A7F989|nr:helix-turn-helix transcriptional regulator [Sphingopyxis sp. YR583]SEH12825.1 DNA-binding transcriptional regulator, XRE-family HTH domain [Sphingopyxis sp. YR583]